MAEVYAGRVTAYAHYLDDHSGLVAALHRNVFAGEAGNAQALADYVGASRTALAAQEAAAICRGTISFREPEHEAHRA
jgi:hypothetical protein